MAFTFYADNISSNSATFNNGNSSTLTLASNSIRLSDTINSMNLNANSISFSDTRGQSNLTTTSFGMSGYGGGSLSLTGVNSSFTLETEGTFNISATKIQLNGISPPTTSGQSLIANDPNGGLQWFTITDLLNLEAGVYTNLTNDVNANIVFGRTYTTIPAVVITPDSDSNGQIIPVSLNGVSTTNFSVIFGSNKLKKFNFVVLPVNSANSVNINQMNSGDNASVSILNDPSRNIST